MINIKRSSNTHVVLSYLKMRKGNPSTLEDIYDFNSVKFQYPYVVKRSIHRLIRQGFVIDTGSCYTISAQGVHALARILQEQPIKNYEFKDSTI
jgi:hypothetical protein